VPRLPPVGDAGASPEAARQLTETRARTGRVVDPHRTLAHAPKLAAATQGIARALRNEAEIAALGAGAIPATASPAEAAALAHVEAAPDAAPED
jgi:hypothetical protein